jgi:quercetin dioxygenase-like cupin family protein
MSKRIAAALAGLAALIVIGGVALATPGSGITPTTHVDRNTMAEPVHLNSDRIKFQTKDPVDVRVQTLRMAPGATTGWHSHPGFVIVSITEGTQTLYSADCSSRLASAGESFIETGDEPMLARNETASDVVLVVTFVAPRGVPFRTDQPNPGCPVN